MLVQERRKRERKGKGKTKQNKKAKNKGKSPRPGAHRAPPTLVTGTHKSPFEPALVMEILPFVTMFPAIDNL